MKGKSIKEWKKPKLQGLKFVGNKVNIKGKLYSIKEILNSEEFDKYYNTNNLTPPEERHFYF